MLMADRQTTDCKLRTESRETLAECLGVRPWRRDVLLSHAVCTFYAAIMILPLLPPLCWFHSTPHPTHYFSAYQGPLIVEVVSVMVLLASSKCLETFSLVVKHSILTKWLFCDLLQRIRRLCVCVCVRVCVCTSAHLCHVYSWCSSGWCIHVW